MGKLKAVYRKRLLKLAKHLKSGKLGHEKFDFSKLERCALSECPVVFPRSWKFDGPFPKLRKRSMGDCHDAGEFFGVGYYEFHHLFYPRCQDPEYFGGRRLGDRATAKQVADNILAFLKKVK